MANCTRIECSQCAKVLGGCSCSETVICSVLCAQCRADTAYQRGLEMSELNRKLRELGVAYAPPSEPSESEE